MQSLQHVRLGTNGPDASGTNTAAKKAFGIRRSAEHVQVHKKCMRTAVCMSLAVFVAVACSPCAQPLNCDEHYI